MFLLLVSTLPLAAADYKPVIEQLERQIEYELRDKQIEAVSIALVDDQQLVWSQGFGHADSSAQTPATSRTIYRVGSVSKLFTDIAIMRLVEQGRIDLDVPVTQYLPEFQPCNPFGTPITLRMLMAHRAGLVREPPVGNYFTPDEPSLAATVQSLNETELVYEPGTKTKYSNAGIAVVGYVLEHLQDEPFAAQLEASVLLPCGMRQSSFERKPEWEPHFAKGYMWTYSGRVFEAPSFDLGMAPAGSMYTTVEDLARFSSILFAGGRTEGEPLLKPESIEAMWRLQYGASSPRGGFGLGFFVSEFAGRRRVGHGGAVYGFATTLQALPDEKLAAIVVATRDFANPVADRIAESALRGMLAARDGQPIEPAPQAQRIDAGVAGRLPGRYGHGSLSVEICAEGDELYLTSSSSEYRLRLRWRDDALVADGLLGFGRRLAPKDDQLLMDGMALSRRDSVELPAIPERWQELIGSYGWDHNILEIRVNRDGRLEALIEWFAAYPLEEVGKDRFCFPSWGLYDAEPVTFRRDAEGRVISVNAACVEFQRRPD